MDLCSGHYRKHLAAGLCGRVDIEPVANHIRRLRSRGWTWLLIGAAADVSHMVPHRIYRGGQHRVTKRVADSLLAIEPCLVPSPLRVDVVGTRRRVQALSRIGWSQREICRRLDRHPTMIATALSKGQITAATAYGVAQVYRTLSAVEGPSDSARSRAALAGWAPPLAWEDIDMDDPQARPNLTGYDEETVRALVRGERPEYDSPDMTEAILRLVEQGLPDTRIAEVVGLSPSTVSHRRKKAAA
jgi:hypothetical protein